MTLSARTPVHGSARRGLLTVAAVVGCLAWTAAGAAPAYSALSPHGPQAAAIAEAWWVMLAGASVVLLLVVGIALFVCLRRGAAPARPERIIVIGGLLFPLLVLTALLVYGSTLSARLADAPEPVAVIELTGHQWWWQVRHRVGDLVIERGNELRIPVGQPVRLELHSADVIHSVWVPSLAGKLDLIPGRRNRMTLRADRAGIYGGQCAEFCGALHAHMRLVVIAMPPAEFTRWIAQPEPSDPPPPAFATLGCAGCHSPGVDAPRGPGLAGFAARQQANGAAVEPAALADWLQHRHGAWLQPRFGSVATPGRDDADRLAHWLASLR